MPILFQKRAKGKRPLWLVQVKETERIGGGLPKGGPRIFGSVKRGSATKEDAMWTRSELKDKAKATLKMNYWKTVLVALLVIVIGGGISVAAGSRGTSSQDGQGAGQSQTTIYVDEDMNPDELAGLLEGVDGVNVAILDSEGNVVLSDQDASVEDLVGSTNVTTENVTFPLSPIVIATVGATVLLVMLVAIAVAVVVDVFVINPLLVGTTRFFTRNLNQPAEAKEVAYAFDNNYREIARTMFWRELYIILWGLLLIIPGIVKAYQYRMVPYLLADDPTMDKDRALAESTRMMDGNKWRAFVLDLSFLGWHLLSALTLGVLEVFYVAPYKCMTDAALYESLRYGTPAPALGATSASYVAPQVPVPPFAAAGAPAPAWDEDASVTQGDEPVVPGENEA